MKLLKSSVLSKSSITLGLGALLLLSACGKEEAKIAEAPHKDGQVAVPVEVQILAKTDFQNSQSFFAEAKPSHIGQLIMSAGGTVKKAIAENGQWVKKGQALCDIDADIHKNALDLSEAQLALAETEFSRQEQHLANNTGSKVMLDQSKVQLLQAKQAMLQSKKLYQEATCAAPISGRVGAKYIESNQSIPPGSPTYTVINDNALKLQFGIPENLLREYAKGSKAQITLNDQSTLDAKIDYLAAIIDPMTRTYTAEIRVKNQGKNSFRVGESVKVQVFGKKHKSQWVVPNNAILNFAKTNAIMLVVDNHAIKKEINILSSNQTHSKISGDLKEGDLLVTANQHRLANGSPVKLKESKEVEAK